MNPTNPAGPLVSVEWLAERLREVVVFDATLPPLGVVPVVDTRARYLEGHVPGARFFDIEELSDKGTSLPHMLPSEAEFSREMSALGLCDGQTVVVYEQDGVFSAPRAWWMLRTFGVKDVYVLDGGLKAWMDADLPLDRGVVEHGFGEFHAWLDASVVRSFEDVQGLIAGPVGTGRAQILDARSAGRFAGTAPEPRAGLSSGHMPGATSVPFVELTENGRMKQPDALREVFAAKGVDLSKPMTTSCGSGVTAAVVLMAAEMAGATDVSLYDGSWTEYAQRPEASRSEKSG